MVFLIRRCAAGEQLDTSEQVLQLASALAFGNVLLHRSVFLLSISSDDEPLLFILRRIAGGVNTQATIRCYLCRPFATPLCSKTEPLLFQAYEVAASKDHVIQHFYLEQPPRLDKVLGHSHVLR